MNHDWQTETEVARPTPRPELRPPRSFWTRPGTFSRAPFGQGMHAQSLDKLGSVVSAPQPVLSNWLALLEERRRARAKHGVEQELRPAPTAAGRQVLDLVIFPLQATCKSALITKSCGARPMTRHNSASPVTAVSGGDGCRPLPSSSLPLSPEAPATDQSARNADQHPIKRTNEWLIRAEHAAYRRQQRSDRIRAGAESHRQLRSARLGKAGGSHPYPQLGPGHRPAARRRPISPATVSLFSSQSRGVKARTPTFRPQQTGGMVAARAECP